MTEGTISNDVALAGDPATPPGVLEAMFARVTDATVLGALLRNPSSPAGALNSFVEAAPPLLKHLVQNPAAGDELVLAVVAAHPFEHGVAVAALENTGISSGTFDAIAESLGAPWATIVANIRLARCTRPAPPPAQRTSPTCGKARGPMSASA